MIETIFCILLIINIGFNFWFCALFHRWITKTNDYVESVNAYCDHVFSRSRAIYINQLHEMVSALVKEERYEEANKITKILQHEIADMDEDKKGERVDI